MSEEKELIPFPDQEGRELILATQKGIAMSNAFMTSCSEGLQQVMGQNYVVSDIGMEVAPGHVPTVNELTERISNLAKGTEGVNILKGVLMFCLGDICLVAEQLGEHDNIVAQAVSEFGQSKYNVMQAIRVCRFLPSNKRIPGWSFTHHSEVVNHQKRFADCPEVLDQVVEEARKVPDISCAELRKMLQEASGQPVAKGNRYHKDRYLYFADTGEIFKSDDLAISVLREGTAIGIDMKDWTVLGPEGMATRTIGEAPDEWFLNPIPQEEEDTTVEEPLDVE